MTESPSTAATFPDRPNQARARAAPAGPDTGALSAPAWDRALALDALRGAAILMMVFSAVLPWSGLPVWMYHAQVPPPDRTFVAIPGITWVDLVFPLFLFAMGTAFPFAMARRLEQGLPMWRVSLAILERGFLLGFFAIYLQHVRPFVMSAEPGAATWLKALAGFALLFLIFTRLPKGWAAWQRYGLRAAGWAGAVVLLAALTYPDGAGFSVARRDIILVILTNTAVFGGLIVLLVRHRIFPLLGAMAVVFGLRLASGEAGWVRDLYDLSPIPWILHFDHARYLLVVLPGALAGKLLLEWLRHSPDRRVSWSPWRLYLLLALFGAFVATVLAGLQARWVGGTVVLSALLAGAGLWMVRDRTTETDRLVASLFGWGLFWLFIGLVLEPYEGGIKKDPSTMSYFFVAAGLSFFILTGFFLVTDVFQRERWLRVLIDNGQNPMIAYTGYGNFVLPVLSLLAIHPLLLEFLPGPWLGLLRAIFYTAIVALFVSFLTRRKIFWRT